MTNIFRCITCNAIITAEETKNHYCKPQITKYKTIKATSYFTAKNENNEECVSIEALNNTDYTFVIKKPKLIPLELPCDSINREVTEIKTTDNETESIFSIVLYYAIRKSRYNGIRLRCTNASQTKKGNQRGQHF